MLISDSTLSQNKENHFPEGEIYPLKRTSFSISFAAWNTHCTLDWRCINEAERFVRHKFLLLHALVLLVRSDQRMRQVVAYNRLKTMKN